MDAKARFRNEVKAMAVISRLAPNVTYGIIQTALHTNFEVDEAYAETLPDLMADDMGVMVLAPRKAVSDWLRTTDRWTEELDLITQFYVV